MADGFPTGFLWGVATASYQIEGSPLADGAGASIWHRFAHTPRTIANGDTGDVACDSYRRWKDDVALMSELGIKSYRFSVAWGRIFPEGTGSVNEKGISFYERFVEALLNAGITPFVTLYHWDLPGALQDRGGWPNRDIAGWFSDYASVLFDRLGDRVRHWITLNEPLVTTNIAHILGAHAPGIRDVYAGLRAQHHQLLAHGMAVKALRASNRGGEIGITLVLTPALPATDSAADVAAAELHADHYHRSYLGPLFGRGYPDRVRVHFGRAWPEERAGDGELIAQPIDFLGINYYSRARVAHAPGHGLLGVRTLEPEGKKTDMGWVIDPQGFHDVLVWLRGEYPPLPIYITENGAAFPDVVDGNGQIEDPDREDYIRTHLQQLRRAISDGVDVRGYFLWSLLDNFEWSFGFSKRFGIVRVEPTDQRRTIKRSGRWYSNVIAANGTNL